jgi:[acyl-carrier-protein] S-malonyltransferase
MGVPWVRHPSWELVEHASDVLDTDVASLLLEADQQTLTETANAQLATFVQSLVVLDAAERVGLEPQAAAGHSLGEYTALVATGALGYEEGLRLVAERGAAMQDAAEQAPGTMTAVLGLADDAVEAACVRAESDVWVANYNAPGQVVIAGSAEGLERAGTVARDLGAKRLVALPVGGAFHTPYMATARHRLRKALAGATFREPSPAVVANVDARPHLDPAEWPGLLSAQLCSPVRWHQTLETLHGSGARTFVELGPGGVLTGLAKRVLPREGTLAVSVSTPEELEQLVDLLAAPAAAASRASARYMMTERLVVSPATGPFTPAPDCTPALPSLARHKARRSEPIRVGVGDLIGWAGAAEIRSAFAGSLEGVLVLPGERVVTGQPVAWLRAESEAEQGQPVATGAADVSGQPQGRPVRVAGRRGEPTSRHR